jgi:hypothetical protein
MWLGTVAMLNAHLHVLSHHRDKHRTRPCNRSSACTKLCTLLWAISVNFVTAISFSDRITSAPSVDLRTLKKLHSIQHATRASYHHKLCHATTLGSGVELTPRDACRAQH